MRKRLFFIIVTAIVFITQMIICNAAILSKSAPIDGDYLLAINTSINVENVQDTGVMSTEIYGQDSRLFSSEAIAQNNVEPTQIDPRSKLKSIKKIADGSANTSTGLRKSIFATQYSVGDVKEFFVTDFVLEDVISKTFVLKYSGNECNIWLESGSAVMLTDTQINSLGNEFDTNIYTKMTTNFGSTLDLDSDGKAAILLYDINDGYGQSSSLYYGGYFDGNDLLGYNNNMDVLHIDTYPAMGLDKANPNITKCKSTIVHEYQHLINFSDYLINNRGADMPLWINEGLSMAAEHMMYGKLTSRINNYNTSTAIANGYSMFNWDDNSSDVISNYALSYVFMQYLRTQTKGFPDGGEQIYKEIIQSNNRTSTVVEDIMRKFYPTITLDDIQINFKIATLLKEPVGYHGFMGESDFGDLNPKLYTSSGTSICGGGGVIKAISQPCTPTGNSGNIKFVGFKRGSVDLPSASYIGSVASGTRVSLSCITNGASIRYTTDGSMPTETSGNLYTGPIVITEDTTVNAIAYLSGLNNSLVSTFDYFINPKLSVVSYGFYNGIQPCEGVPATAGMYTFKVQYRNNTSEDLTANLVITEKRNGKISDIHIVQCSFSAYEEINIQQDILFPLHSDVPDFEIKVMEFNNFYELMPLGEALRINRA